MSGLFSTSILGQSVALIVGATPGWVKVANNADYSSIFAKAALTNQVPLFQLDARCIIHGIKIKHNVAFLGGGIASYTISVGDITNNQLFATPYNVFQAPATNNFQLSDNFYAEDDFSPVQIYATATSTGANLNQATQGLVDIWALLSRGPA